jgi:hypothetical protein
MKTNQSFKIEDNIQHRFFDPSKLLKGGDLPSITNRNQAWFAKLSVSRLLEEVIAEFDTVGK